MRHVRQSSPLLVVLLALTLVAAACGGGSKKSASTPTENARKGGTLVLSAEQELDCAAFIATCGNNTWGTWTLGEHVLPRAFDVDAKTGAQVASILLDGDPKVDAGAGKITYKINPKAVWSDGQPITSADFKFTSDTVNTRQDTYDKTGYKNIQSIDTPDDHTAVVTFKPGQAFGDWRELFGGFYGVIPKHLLDGKDVTAEMTNGFTWSGGPWKLDHWTKGQELALVPNTNYWGQKPNLDKVVFKFITDTAAETSAFKTGQVALIYPQPQLEETEIKALPNVTTITQGNFNFEAIWINTQKPVVSSKAVRQALAYATDRAVIVTQLFGGLKPDSKPIQSFSTPAAAKVYATSFSKYTRDLSKVTSLMTGDGWTKGSDGIWTKGGQRADLVVRSTAGNHRRELTEQIMQSQWKEAGFNLTVDNKKSSVLFSNLLPAGDFQIALFAETPTDADPSNMPGCTLFCSENIPTPQAPSGANYWRLNDPTVDSTLKGVDNSLVDSSRITDAKKGQDLLAEAIPGIPLDMLFEPVFYYNNRVGGPIGDNPVYGAYYNMNTWFCKTPSC